MSAGMRYACLLLLISGCYRHYDYYDPPPPHNQPTTSLELSAHATTVSVSQGGSASDELELREDNATDAIGISVQGLPDGLTATINPSPSFVGPNALYAVSFVAETSVALGSYIITFVAADAESSSSATVVVTVTAPLSTAQTVTVHTLDASGGVQAGVRVMIGSSVQATSVDGTATFTAVTPPYDLIYLQPGTAKVAWVLQGLTSTTPTALLTSGTAPVSTEQNGSVGLSVSPTGTAITAVPTSQSYLFGAVFANGRSNFAPLPEGTSIAPYAFALTGPVVTSPLITLDFLALALTAGVPTGYAYAGTGSTTLAHYPGSGDTFTFDNAALSVPTVTTPTLTLAPASGYTVSQKILLMDFARSASTSLYADHTGATSVTLPVIAGTSFTNFVELDATNASGDNVRQTSSISATSASYAIAAGVQNLQPSGTSTPVAKTSSFSWEAMGTSALYIVDVGGTDFSTPAAGYSIIVVTRENHFTLPDVSAIDATYVLPANNDLPWSVSAVSSATSVDEAVANRLTVLNPNRDPVVTGASTVTSHASRVFHTASSF